MTADVHSRARCARESCRCRDCRKVNADYAAQAALREYPARVGAARARQHALDLAAAGVGARQLAIAADVSMSTISKLLGLHGSAQSKRIKPETERAILGVTPRDMAMSKTLPLGKTSAQLQTLLNRGWTRTAVGVRISGPTARPFYLTGKRVTVRVARIIESLLVEGIGDFDPVADRRHRRQQEALSVDDHRNEMRNALRATQPSLDPPDTKWMLDAACRTRKIPTWVFFPGRGDAATSRAALKICNECPVIIECRDWERTNPQSGTWGGMTEKQRQQKKRGAK